MGVSGSYHGFGQLGLRLPGFRVGVLLGALRLGFVHCGMSVLLAVRASGGSKGFLGFVCGCAALCVCILYANTYTELLLFKPSWM